MEGLRRELDKRDVELDDIRSRADFANAELKVARDELADRQEELKSLRREKARGNRVGVRDQW